MQLEEVVRIDTGNFLAKGSLEDGPTIDLRGVVRSNVELIESLTDFEVCGQEVFLQVEIMHLRLVDLHEFLLGEY